MARKRQGGNFGNFGSDSFSRIPKVEEYTAQLVRAAFGGSLPNTIYTSDRESTWSRWRRGWELAAANGVERPSFMILDIKFQSLIMLILLV